ncbi:MAG: glycosyltransferase family 4 protein, partial [Cytophagales bacterium]|nr:glycosyltransferase family 4 protein [Cytophagales bacterium]
LCVGKELKKLKQFVREEKFDVIHYHTIWNPFLALQIRMISQAHQVATFHDTPSNTVIGKFLGSWVMPFMGKIVFNWLDQIISVSETQKKCISRFSKRKVEVISNGIEPLEVGEIVEKYADGKFNLLFLGRLEPRKGIMDAVKAFEIFVSQMPESRLLVAGEGRERQKAEQYCKDNGLNGVIFLGQVDDQEKRDLLASADLFIASALYGESFGIVLLEAMQAGIPLIGYSNDGYKELLTQEQLEYFVKPGDVLELANVALKIHELDRSRLTVHGKKHASDFEWEKLVEEVEKLY